MTQGAFYQRRRTSPTALAIVVLMHGAAITALALAKMDVIPGEKFDPTDVFDVFTPPPPPAEPVKPVVRTAPLPDIYVPKPVVAPPTNDNVVSADPEPQPYYPPLPKGPVIEADPAPLPPPPPSRKVQPARAKGNLASHVSDSDYPASAIRGEEQGTTRFRLTVSPAGRVTDCVVTASSGSGALDTATCRIMKSRARFTPAMNSDGQPVGDTVASAIRWVLPDE
jgi:protein TonB